MVTLKSSHSYTVHAIKSFFKYTKLENDDEFILIDNDNNELDEFRHYNKINIIKNSSPLSFAENVNQGIKIALNKDKNLVFLNNDIIFTKKWFESIKLDDTGLSISTSNQLFQYKSICENLNLKHTMEFKDFNEKYSLLDEIVTFHKKKFKDKKKFQTPLMPFFCFKIPNKILKTVGFLDTSFGKGGGEDIDYRIRCAAKGLEVNFLIQSYVLHFHGKSTWDGNETPSQTEDRNNIYTKVFLKKWGKDMTQIFILRKDFIEILNKKGLIDLFKKGKFGSLIRRFL